MRASVYVLLGLCLIFGLQGCEDPVKKEQAAVDKVKQTVIPNCDGRTMGDLAGGLLQNPVWTLESKDQIPTAMILSGTLMGEALPNWVRDQNLLDIKFRLPLDTTGAYDPKALDGFPSLSTPEGILQAYKLLLCD